MHQLEPNDQPNIYIVIIIAFSIGCCIEQKVIQIDKILLLLVSKPTESKLLPSLSHRLKLNTFIHSLDYQLHQFLLGDQSGQQTKL